MGLLRMWQRMRNFRRWKKATTPMLLNADTGELIPFTSYTVPPTGKWMLRRPLTLPGSTPTLFLEAPFIPSSLAECGSAGTNDPGHQRGGFKPHTSPSSTRQSSQQSV